VLFIFPGAGGSMSALNALKARLEQTAVTRIVDYRDGGDVMSSNYDIEKLIRQVTEEALSTPNRVWLLGYSLGGAIAAEVAHRLEVKQQEPDWIGIIDGRVPRRDDVWSRSIHRSSLKDWFGKGISRFSGAEHVGSLETWARECASAVSSGLIRREHYKGIRALYAAARCLGLERLSRRIFASAAAAQHYRQFQPFPLSRIRQTVWLFTSDDPIYDRVKIPDLGWASLCDALHIHSLEGGHFSVLQPPFVDALISAILASTSASGAGHDVIIERSNPPGLASRA
jgi:thioesterase domain-containing protein